MNTRIRNLAYAIADSVNRYRNIRAYVVHTLDVEIQYSGYARATIDNPSQLIDAIEKVYFDSRLRIVNVDMDSLVVTYRIKTRTEWV